MWSSQSVCVLRSDDCSCFTPLLAGLDHTVGGLTRHGSIPAAGVPFSGQMQRLPPDEYHFVVVVVVVLPLLPLIAVAGGGDARAASVAA